MLGGEAGPDPLPRDAHGRTAEMPCIVDAWEQLETSHPVMPGWA